MKKSFIIGCFISLIVGMAIGTLVAESRDLFRGVLLGIIYSVGVSGFWTALAYCVSNKTYKTKKLSHQLPSAIFAIITIYTIPLPIAAYMSELRLSFTIRLAFTILAFIGFCGTICSFVIICCRKKERCINDRNKQNK